MKPTYNYTRLRASDITVGDELPALDLPISATLIVAGAVASRDFMPVHHDKNYAQAQGAPDIFMNILTTNGYVSRFVTDWAGPEAMVKNIKIRLGAPVVPDQILHFSGQVEKVSQEGDECVVDVAIRASNDLGDRCKWSSRVTL